MKDICGTSEEARKLSSLLEQTITSMNNDIASMKTSVSRIKNGWQDAGVGEVDEILASIEKALTAAQEEAPHVIRALKKYADFLERR